MAYRDILICTVGTSLKGNLDWIEDEDVRLLLEEKNVQGLTVKLLAYPSEDRKLGAEINSIARIVAQGKIQNRKKLFLLVSDTKDGDFLGQVLKQYFENSKNPLCFEWVEKRVINGLTDEEPQRFRSEGLRNLVREISQIVRMNGSDRIVINATGGYKAQISFAGMIGQALMIPVCYLFERFSEVIELPPQPVSLDLSFWLENVELFYELEKDSLSHALPIKDQRLETLVEEIQVDGQKMIGLSPTGQLFHETFRYRFSTQKNTLLPPPSDKPWEKKKIVYEDQNKGRHAGLEEYLHQLIKIPYIERIYTHYFNPRLPSANYFRKSTRGIDHVEGCFSHNGATTKFDLITTAKTEAERDAVLADLWGKMKR